MNDYYLNRRILVCFFVIKDINYDYLAEGYYTINSNSIAVNLNYINDLIKIENIKFIKSDSNYNMERSLVCYVKTDNEAFCNKFYLNNYGGYFYGSTRFINPCKAISYGMHVRYFYETDEVSFICSVNNGKIQSIFFDKDLEVPGEVTFKQFSSCETIYGFSVLYSAINEDYYVLSDVSCNGVKIPFISLFIEYNNITDIDENNNNFYNEEKEIEENEIEEIEKEEEEEKENVNKIEEDNNIDKNYIEEEEYIENFENETIFNNEENDSIQMSILKENIDIKEPCNYYFYYDSINNYQCTTDFNCPINYSKLIIKRKQCINECKNDNIYNLEYNNICYKECPSGTNNNNNICKGKIICKDDLHFL